jgi:cell division protein FtsL
MILESALHELDVDSPAVRLEPLATEPSTRPAPSAGDTAARIDRGAFGPTPQRDKHLKVVDPKERTPLQKRRRAIALAGTFSVVFFAFLFGLAAFQAVIVQHQQHLDDVTRAVTAETARLQQLTLEVQMLQAPKRVIDQAKQQGMVEPATIAYLQPPAAVVKAFDDASSTQVVSAGNSLSSSGAASNAP